MKKAKSDVYPFPITIPTKTPHTKCMLIIFPAILLLLASTLSGPNPIANDATYPPVNAFISKTNIIIQSLYHTLGYKYIRN